MIHLLFIKRLAHFLFVLWLLLFVDSSVLAQAMPINVVVFVNDKESNTLLTEVTLRMKDLKTGKEFLPVFNKVDKSFSIQVPPEITVSIYGTAEGYTEASINIHDIKNSRRVVLDLSKVKRAHLKISALDAADGRFIPTATVKVTYKTPETSTQTYSLKKGVLELEIFDGPYTIEMTAMAPEYTSVTKNLVVETATGAGKNYEFVAKLERTRSPEPARIAPVQKPIPEKKQEETSFGKLEKGKVVVLNSIYFDQSSSVLRPESGPQLDELAEVLRQNPTTRIEIRGHTDNIGDFDLNVKLSRDRCQAVVEYLLKKGLAANRLQILGRGPIDAVAPNNTEENRKKNRRVELIVL